MNNTTKPIGIVEGRSVYPGDRLYVDIRGTVATEWGTGQIAEQGTKEGQGSIIIFQGGDYRMCDRLVWEPKELSSAPVALVQDPAPDYANPDKYTREELVKILTAFFDIADGIREHEYIDHTDDSSGEAARNYGEARKLVCDKRWGIHAATRAGA
jgi:hypothetical protein